MKEFLESIAAEVKDIFDHDIETTKAYVVPGRDDATLTFGRNQVKKGKLIETCVLFIDIRNSTKLSRQLKKDKVQLGKIYSAFIDAMTTIADRYGFVRNIIGDRVMVVFEPANCFVDAMNCAVTMYTVANRILKTYIKGDLFSVGIGVDYGEMLILKTGIQKKDENRSEYKNLVWVGDTANSASKLTDFANKYYNAPLYNVTYEYYPYGTFFWPTGNKPSTTTAKLNGEEFLLKIKTPTTGWTYEGNKVVGISKEENSGSTSPILISGKVYDEFKKALPKSPILAKFEKKTYPNPPLTGSGIYGGYYYLPDMAQVNL
jgi:adenylate cyclase